MVLLYHEKYASETKHGDTIVFPLHISENHRYTEAITRLLKALRKCQALYIIEVKANDINKATAWDSL